MQCRCFFPLGNLWKRAHMLLTAPVYVGRPLDSVPPGAIVFAPLDTGRLCCGLAGLVAVRPAESTPPVLPLDPLVATVDQITANRLPVKDAELEAAVVEDYLGGASTVTKALSLVGAIKEIAAWHHLVTDAETRTRLRTITDTLSAFAKTEIDQFQARMGTLPPEFVTAITARLESLQDLVWRLDREILANAQRISDLSADAPEAPTAGATAIHHQINTVLNSIDCLEVRGRDSAGVSLLFDLSTDAHAAFENRLTQFGHLDAFRSRQHYSVLGHQGIHLTRQSNGVAIALTYKVAAEIGSLGDNIQFIRNQIAADPIFHLLATQPHRHFTINTHTRWASVGAISVPNCHPVDNVDDADTERAIIHVVLNGDIDNHRELKASIEARGNKIPAEITTDTKIIPLQIQHYLDGGCDVTEAFRRAVNDFEGSHAICMHTSLAPGRLFLAQRGSGQAIFVGIAPDHYMATSEVYGFIESTQQYFKLDGERIIQGQSGVDTQGQMVVLDQASAGGLDGMTAMAYDGTPLPLSETDLRQTDITSRDINRQDFDHYFLKEISESPRSVAMTLANRWRLVPDGSETRHTIALDATMFPDRISDAFANRTIRRIYFVGQGTAGVAAQACASILDWYLDDPAIQVAALKASELSGFKLGSASAATMSDALVVAISQSGTTTDTNRTVDMARAQGAFTVGIVNRRDSDLTFKVDGVMYTSSGRDIEMSVASTKAFYAQITAGALLSLQIAFTTQRRDASFIDAEIQRLLAIPDQMRKVLGLGDQIRESAFRLAPSRTYWAAVGSGPNKASADEIRIKLSELCYKTISSDFVEDKKHIDLSSEPLILICAAGTRDTVIGDIIKDTAIFQAHKAIPVVIAAEGEERFAPYAADVFHVPLIAEHLAPIVNTLAGHLWGYYAALAINDGSRKLFTFQTELQETIDAFALEGMDVYEVALEKRFREKILAFDRFYRNLHNQKQLPSVMGLGVATDMALLLKYLAGRIPVSDFVRDFGRKGTAANMINTFFERLGDAINNLARPVDAIKHQAKTVTVGTSRLSEKTDGPLFDALSQYGIHTAQLINRNIVVIRNLQPLIGHIQGAIVYQLTGLNTLGEPTTETRIDVLRKEGSLAPLPSRVETDKRLKGTKAIIARQGNVYIGKGRKDDRNIIIIPAMATAPERSHHIEQILLLHIDFKEVIALTDKIQALGGKYDHIVNIVQENSLKWRDDYLELLPTEEIFGLSAEKIGESIAAKNTTG